MPLIGSLIMATSSFTPDCWLLGVISFIFAIRIVLNEDFRYIFSRV